MRLLLIVTISLSATALGRLQATEPDTSEKRYNQTLDLKKYPQDTPKAALSSLIKAIENKDVEYILAHLADPKFVDQRVADLGGKFESLAEETRRKLLDDPRTLKLFKRFSADGDWKAEEDRASLTLKDEPDKQLFFIKRKDRWFLENRNQPEKLKER